MTALALDEATGPDDAAPPDRDGAVDVAGYFADPVPVPAPDTAPAVPVPAAGFVAPALPVPAPFGCAVMPMGAPFAGTAEVLVGAESVAFGFDESVPFCELAADAAKADEAVMSAEAATTARIVMRFMGFPSATRHRGDPAT